MDIAEFHAAVYDTVRRIPIGKVTSYGTNFFIFSSESVESVWLEMFTNVNLPQGHIAKLIGMPTYSRHVGQALKLLDPGHNPPLPWHRVISSSGAISSRGPGTDGAERQRQALEEEDIQVVVGRTGDLKVDLKVYGWFPDRLNPETVDST